MTMRDLYNLLFKRKWTLFLLFVLFAGGMTVAAMKWPPTYHSIASLYLRSKRETVDQSLEANPTINRGVSLLLPDVLSEVELVKSSEVRRLVVDKLGLENEAIPSTPGARPLERLAQRTAWDAYLYENILVEAATSANVINITCTDNQPQRAARIVGAYADCYLEFRKVLATGGASVVGLGAEADSASRRMTEAELALTSFNEQWHVVDTTAQKLELLNLLARTRTQVTDERAALERAQADLREYSRLLESKSPEVRGLEEVRANSNCQNYESQISTQSLALADLLQHNKETADAVIQARRSLKTLEDDLVQKASEILQGVVLTRKMTADSIQSGLAVHEKMVETIESELAVLVSKVGANDRLAVDLDVLRDHYKMVNRRLNLARFESAIGGTGNVDVIVANHGVAPNKPYFPPPFVLSVLVAIFTGLLVSFSFVVVLDIVDQSFKTPDELEKNLSENVLATIPKRSDHRLTRLLEA